MRNIKAKTCCYKGHRSFDLPWDYNEDGKHFKRFVKEFTLEVEKAINDGYTHFLGGILFGSEMIMARIILRLKKKYPFIKFTILITSNDEADNWNINSYIRHSSLCNETETICMSNNKYSHEAHFKKYKTMINRSSRMIVAFNGNESLTKQVKRLAHNAKLEIREISLKKP